MIAKNALPLASIPSEIHVDTNETNEKYKIQKIEINNSKQNDRIFRDVNDNKKDIKSHFIKPGII